MLRTVFTLLLLAGLYWVGDIIWSHKESPEALLTLIPESYLLYAGYAGIGAILFIMLALLTSRYRRNRKAQRERSLTLAAYKRRRQRERSSAQ